MTNILEVKAQIKSSKIKLSRGTITQPEVNKLVNNLEKLYKKEEKTLNSYLKYFAHQELKKRLNTSVFAETGKKYPPGYAQHCIKSESIYTKRMIKVILSIIEISKKQGNILESEFYGVQNSKFTISWELIVHMQFRHNAVFQSIPNPDSKKNGYNPTVQDFFSIPVLLMFKSLEALQDKDWIIAKNKNLLVHFKLANKCYTIIRKGSSNEILSYFPKENCDDCNPIELTREVDEFKIKKK